MRVAIIGNGRYGGDIGAWIPAEADEILIGGTQGICAQAADWADARGVAKLVIDDGWLGEEALVELADLVIACGADVRTEKPVIALA